MAKTKVVSKREILSAPTEPLTIDRRKNVAALLEKMRGISFQGRNLAIAYQIWRRMLGDREMIMMGMSGAMVPAGMRRLGVYMIKKRLIYCPTSPGANFSHALHETLGRFHFQCSPEIGDVLETARLAAESPVTGVVYFGGGTPKNFVNQTEVTATFMRNSHHGHKYALQIITDAPHWGGLSGCTFAESQSWGKIAHNASMVEVHCDSTIAMPMLVTALSEDTALIRI